MKKVNPVNSVSFFVKKKTGYSLKAFCLMNDLDYNAVKLFDEGTDTTQLSMSDLIKISKILNVSCDELFGL